ncbi:MAG: lysophospholipid acyltransferase family protein [Ktedonobacteraceae bacterium]|nr:lysophospholipid acyltransferase family protein [Ktedonobacteraceae bacterium]MBV9710476.1 lysophospholipid acyltransferase family protein [Ktedonobacteraceae bacterium]
MSSVYWLARGGSTLAKWTPRPVRHTLGSVVSAGSYLGWRAKRRVTLQNMAQVTGRSPRDPYVQRLAFASWANYGRYASDFMYFPYMDIAACEANMRDLSQGGSWSQFLDQALEPGKGAVVATAHFGSWDLAGALVGRHYPLSAVAETFTDPRLNELLQNQRRDKGISVIPLESSARRILRVLQKNEPVALVVDRPLSAQEGTPVRFFGRTTYVPGGPATLAVMSGASIFPGYVWYGHHHRFYVRGFEPISPRPCKGAVEREKEILRLTQYIYDALETVVREWPSQWYMFRPFWPSTTANENA